MAINKLVEDVARVKARRMLNKRDWRAYAQEFAGELGAGEEAFLAGAIDAMIYDVAAIITPRRIPSHDDRKQLVKDILRSGGTK